MKKTDRKKKIVLIALAVVLTLTLCGCGGKNSGSEGLPVNDSVHQPDNSAGVGTGTEPSEEAVPGVMTTDDVTVAFDDLAHRDQQASAEVLYTSVISDEAVKQLYLALGRKTEEKTAVLVSVGQKDDPLELDPALLGGFLETAGGTLAANTEASGDAATADGLRKMAEDSGLLKLGSFDVLDEEGSFSLPVKSDDLQSLSAGSHLQNYTFLAVITQMRPDPDTGFRGALRQLGFGAASAEGRRAIEAAAAKEGAAERTEEMCGLCAEAAKAVYDHMGGGQKIVYITVLRNIPADGSAVNIGALASTDPVALDQACLDFILAAEGDAAAAQFGLPDADELLEEAEERGLGSRKYKLFDING